MTIKEAILSKNRLYRYVLSRQWDLNKGTCLFIGLNPSTADENEDDPTLRRCVNFAKEWGYGKYVMLNLFAYRSTDPSELKRQAKPIGYKNNFHIKEQCNKAELIVIAWGNHGSLLERDKQVLKLLKNYPIYCFKVTKQGQPAHPLYQPKTAKLIEF